MPKKTNQYRKEARRDVKLSHRPERQAYRRARRQGKREARQAGAQYEDIYGDLAGQLQGAQDFYTNATAGIPGQLNTALTGLQPYFNQTVGAPVDAERNAGNTALGTLGAGFQSQFASDTSRNAAYGASALRQGAEEEMIGRRNIQTDLQNFLRELTQQQLDSRRGYASEIRARQDELSRNAFDRRMALANLALGQGQLGIAQQESAAGLQYQNLMNAFFKDLMNDPAALAEWLRANGG